jgi:hypothetical protein
MIDWQPIDTAPRDGRRILCSDGHEIQVCWPKQFPRPIAPGDDLSVSKPGDAWEYFRDEKYAPGHTWSMVPTHWAPLI